MSTQRWTGLSSYSGDDWDPRPRTDYTSSREEKSQKCNLP